MSLNLVENSKIKIVWAHDQYTLGEEWTEFLVKEKRIDNVFTLSDYQTLSFLKRLGSKSELYKNLYFRTRNGIKTYVDNSENLLEKDKNLFVFSSVYKKGMHPLLEKVWPRIKKEIPDAKLLIIGGAYTNFNESADWDENQTSAISLKNKWHGFLDVTFTGYLKQEQIAKIMRKASYLLYPNIYEETFGITILEAINYNVVAITNKYGALEEVADSSVSYLVDGPFNDEVLENFVEQVKLAYFNDELREVKAKNCNDFKPFISWENVALH
jgi:glycosyltransferase involved in cell wall biosynthesis